MMWEIVLSGGLEHGWPTPNNCDKGEEEEENLLHMLISKLINNKTILLRDSLFIN